MPHTEMRGMCRCQLTVGSRRSQSQQRRPPQACHGAPRQAGTPPAPPGRTACARAGRSSGPAAASAVGETGAGTLWPTALCATLSDMPSHAGSPVPPMQGSDPLAPPTHQYNGHKGVGEERGPGGPQHHIRVRVLRQAHRQGAGWAPAAGHPPSAPARLAGARGSAPALPPGGHMCRQAAAAHPAGAGVGRVLGHALAVRVVPSAPPRKVVGHDAGHVRDEQRHACSGGSTGGHEWQAMGAEARRLAAAGGAAAGGGGRGIPQDAIVKPTGRSQPAPDAPLM